jgi:DNA polymerase-3 subunit delta
MAIYKRNDTDKMLKAVEQGKVSTVYLFIGERYLCGQVADQLIGALVPDSALRQQCVKLIDGDEEDLAKTLASLKTYSMFSGKQIIRVSDTRLFHSNQESSPPGNDPADLFMEAFATGIPENNTLLLLAETVDKRKKFYKFISKHGAIADLSVATGSSTAARTDQESVLKSLINTTLAEFGKKIEPQAVPEFLDRVGFHPVAVVRETEKLALYAGTDPVITVQSVREIVGRTREDALYELTEAYTEQQLNKVLLLTQRLFNEGMHPLVMVSGLRNHLKKLLLVRSIRDSSPPSYISGMSYAMFQKGYLPELKAAKEEWLGLLPAHPYALYLMFDKAGRHPLSSLAAKMTELLQVEHCLKSSSIAPQIFFERFLWNTLIAK